MERLNSSRLVRMPAVQTLDRYLQAAFDATGVSIVLRNLREWAHGIVAQDEGAVKSVRNSYRLNSYGANKAPDQVSTGARLSFVCLSLLVITGSWMIVTGPSPAEVGDVAEAQPTVQEPPVSLAIVNPTNVAREGTDVQPLAVIAPPGREGEMNAAASGNAALTVRTLRNGAATPTRASENLGSLAVLAPTATASPTPTPTSTSTPTPTPTATATEHYPDAVPQVRIVGPSSLQPTATPTPTPTTTPTPTPTPPPIEPGRIWATFEPGPAAETDHFWIERPFPSYAQNQLASPSYQFGSTASSRYRIHHGIDIANPLGTAVLAGAVGEVIHAGFDDEVLLGPYNGFYGNAVVIRLERRLPVAGGELDVYALYGHLSEVRVAVGQQVQPGDIVGLVGMTGIAIGPHLHLEMRLGANTYDHSVNPYLWLRPVDGSGAVAVRLLSAEGRTWPRARVSLARFGAGGAAVWARQIEIYPDDENLGPDPAWGENGAMGSVPAGEYVVLATINGERLREEITVRAGETTFVEMRTQQ